MPIYIGYWRGKFVTQKLVERVRGWIYFLFSLTSYFIFIGLIEFLEILNNINTESLTFLNPRIAASQAFIIIFLGILTIIILSIPLKILGIMKKTITRFYDYEFKDEEKKKLKLTYFESYILAFTLFYLSNYGFQFLNNEIKFNSKLGTVIFLLLIASIFIFLFLLFLNIEISYIRKKSKKWPSKLQNFFFNLMLTVWITFLIYPKLYPYLLRITKILQISEIPHFVMMIIIEIIFFVLIHKLNCYPLRIIKEIKPHIPKKYYKV